MSYPAPPPPPQADYFRSSDHEGALMVYRVKAHEPQYSGWSEPQPAVRCDVEAIDRYERIKSLVDRVGPVGVLAWPSNLCPYCPNYRPYAVDLSIACPGKETP